jgi:RNA polymerase sigma-70 factor (ECF subfamily)
MIAATLRRNRLPAASNQSERGSEEWPSMRDSLDQIVTACQRGDRAAQRALYEHCNPRVFRLAVRMVGAQEASDLTQQVFLRVYHTIHQFTGRSGFETWLYRLAVNECLQFLRYAKRRPHEALDHEPAVRCTDVSREIQVREMLELAVQRLDSELRAVFLLREVEGLGYRELAETLEISEGTVASRLSRARSKLKEYLLDLGWEF